MIIQTFRPDAPEVKLAAEHATEQYLEQELKLRNHLGYPPETEMIRFIFRGENVSLRAKAFAENFKNIKDTTASVAPTLFGGGTVWHVLLKGPRLRSLLKKIDCSYCTVDVDPMECV